ncbi:invasion associated locus B family protein [Oricola sp.]|uniref:invasion associated locus B family protein n=1 Tax=Oricola sp. TaxID=1979950 RepID=UPI0025F33C22|nr:invasion associated locus B family protein [Oricola sp.]MCI5074946.1 invasion associated locus B family protein [Oricola sp.]
MFIDTKVISGLLAASLVAASATGAWAQTPTRIGDYSDWSAFSYNSGNSKVCYTLSVPIPGSEKPAEVNHGTNFFIVTQRTTQNVSYEPQFMADYALRDSSKVTVTVGDKSFTFFTKDKSAWAENAAQEPALVAAMKAGSKMTVTATSARGTNTSYDYSLSGVTAALDAIQNCK